MSRPTYEVEGGYVTRTSGTASGAAQDFEISCGEMYDHLDEVVLYRVEDGEREALARCRYASAYFTDPAMRPNLYGWFAPTEEMVEVGDEVTRDNPGHSPAYVHARFAIAWRERAGEPLGPYVAVDEEGRRADEERERRLGLDAYRRYVAMARKSYAEGEDAPECEGTWFRRTCRWAYGTSDRRTYQHASGRMTVECMRGGDSRPACDGMLFVQCEHITPEGCRDELNPTIEWRSWRDPSRPNAGHYAIREERRVPYTDEAIARVLREVDALIR